MRARVLVVAKAPVPGLAKTRLGRVVGPRQAAELAAAALLDTLAAAQEAAPGCCHLALEGQVEEGCRSGEIEDALGSWHVFGQRGDSLGERIAHAHTVLAREGPGPVVQVGMDTPQLTSRMLRDAAGALGPECAVLGPAVDGGWWLLGLAEPDRAGALVGVPTSTASTGRDTAAALSRAGVRVRRAPMLRDVDTVHDAGLVARAAPTSRFAAAWAQIGPEVA